MKQAESSKNNPLTIVWPIVYAGAILGLILSWLVLSGDQQGKVNLFYLLLVYLLIPVFSVIISAFSLVFGKGINLARLIIAIPVWSYPIQSLLRKNHQLNLDKYWFLLQSQAAAIAFSLASLLVFFILLLATDLNFVWRSTILEPEDILPLLEIVALPWHFWTTAQPDLLLLQMTQDSRLAATSSNSFSDYGAWWQFILATQICYSLLLRLALIAITRWWLKKALAADLENILQTQIIQHSPLKKETFETAPIIHKLPNSLPINNWDNIPAEILVYLTQINCSEDRLIVHDRQLDVNSDHSTQTEQLLIVKAWEAPLGELEDYMQHGRGYLLPLDWNDRGLIQLRPHHLSEWQRLVNQLPNWQLFLPQELQPQ